MSAILVKIVAREYRDSVSLMQLSAMLGRLAGIEQASAVMAATSVGSTSRAASPASAGSAPASPTTAGRPSLMASSRGSPKPS